MKEPPAAETARPVRGATAQTKNDYIIRKIPRFREMKGGFFYSILSQYGR